MVAGQPSGLWLWLNPFTSPFVLAETRPTPCTVPSTCPLVKVVIFGPARELGGGTNSSRWWCWRIVLRWKKSCWKSCSNVGSESEPRQSRFHSRPLKANIYTDVKTHVAFGEDAYQKRAMPLIPMQALIPYIYVLTNNSFIDFIKERQRERERGGRVRKGEWERKRETKSVHCLFTPTFTRPCFLAPFSFFLHWGVGMGVFTV